jgi:hypothetical protein
MGWLWQRVGRSDWLRPPARPVDHGSGRGAAFWASVRHDVLHAGGFLVVGAMAAATLKAVVPESWAAGHGRSSGAVGAGPGGPGGAVVDPEDEYESW